MTNLDVGIQSLTFEILIRMGKYISTDLLRNALPWGLRMYWSILFDIDCRVQPITFRRTLRSILNDYKKVRLYFYSRCLLVFFVLLSLFPFTFY
jgi:hypothetical protein